MDKSYSLGFWIIILSVLILAGCFNDFSFNLLPKIPLNNCTTSCFIFQGKVFDPNNSEFLSAKIDLVYYGDGYISFPVELGQVESNSSGFYAVNFNATDYKDGSGSFVLTATRAGYLTNEYDGRVVIGDIDSTNFGMPILANILLRPKATLQFKFGISKPTQLQSLSYAYQYAEKKYQHQIYSEKWAVDTLYTQPVAGDQFVYTWVNYKANNQSYTIQDSIYLKKGETKLVETMIN
ncbi:MAG: hypothetical protein KA479_13590 [Saprospiraceae bacterium]|nr:hypothetical protein [Saprospiraceae bacterium]